jgi:hypothetical protein
METETLGIIGMAFVGLAIAFETYQNFREKKKPDLRFAAFYFFGSAFLSYYAYGMGEWIFFALNAFTALLALVNVYQHVRN